MGHPSQAVISRQTAAFSAWHLAWHPEAWHLAWHRSGASSTLSHRSQGRAKAVGKCHGKCKGPSRWRVRTTCDNSAISTTTCSHSEVTSFVWPSLREMCSVVWHDFVAAIKRVREDVWSLRREGDTRPGA